MGHPRFIVSQLATGEFRSGFMSVIVFGWVPMGRPPGAGIVSGKMKAWFSLISIPSVTSGLVRFTFSWSFGKASSIWRPMCLQMSRLV